MRASDHGGGLPFIIAAMAIREVHSFPLSIGNIQEPALQTSLKGNVYVRRDFQSEKCVPRPDPR